MVKVWFPTFFMRLVKINTSITPSFAKLQVPPSMTKTEIREYLNKIYSVNVEKVMTANHLGRWKRLQGKRRIISYKRRNFKLAYVLFNENMQLGTGIADNSSQSRSAKTANKPTNNN